MPSRTGIESRTTPRSRPPQMVHQTPEFSDDDSDIMTQQADLEDVHDRDAYQSDDEDEDEEERHKSEEGEAAEEALAEETQYDQHAESTVPPTPPPGLKEISSLASWTVSSSKPGCGVGALRAPTTTTYWQSDGPQPHWLNIHFFKMVSICAMRIHLDYASDESYTPSRIEFYAGTHAGDLQLWSELQVREPRGWLTVDFSGVGDLPEGAENWEEDDEFDVEKLPILRCMLLQLKICENHQNGKDTHLRGLQILAKDGQAKTKANNKAHIALSQGSSFDMPVRTKKKDMDWDFLGDFDSMPTIR